MNPIEYIDPEEVRLFKKLLYGSLSRWTKGGGLEFHPLVIAAAAEEVAQEIRQRAAEEFKATNS